MKCKFICYGHENILATHKTTLEITKDKHLTKTGDCIIGINADFELEKLKPFLKKKKCTLILEIDKLKETITFNPNPNFFDSDEIVIRLGNFTSQRTLGTDGDKASIHLDRNFVQRLQSSTQEVKVTLKAL